MPPPSARLFTFRALRGLGLGAIAMGAVAWILTPAGVVAGLILGLPAAFAAPKLTRLRQALLLTVALGVVGVHAGILLFGTGTTRARLLTALISTLAVAPWLFLLTLVLWVRSRTSDDASS